MHPGPLVCKRHACDHHFGRRPAALRRGHRRRRPHRGRRRPGPPGLGRAIDTASAEAAFLHRWGGVATADDQWARFQRLAWLSDPSAATRQAARLDPAHHAAAEARLAAKRDDPKTEALVAALPPALQSRPGPGPGPRPIPAPHRSRRGGGGAADPDAGRRQPLRVLVRTKPAGAQAAARRRSEDRLRGRRREPPDRRRSACGCRVPGRLHRAAHAARPGNRRETFFDVGPIARGHHAGTRALLAGTGGGGGGEGSEAGI